MFDNPRLKRQQRFGAIDKLDGSVVPFILL